MFILLLSGFLFEKFQSVLVVLRDTGLCTSELRLLKGRSEGGSCGKETEVGLVGTAGVGEDLGWLAAR